MGTVFSPFKVLIAGRAVQRLRTLVIQLLTLEWKVWK